jgi:hypothetical protein
VEDTEHFCKVIYSRCDVTAEMFWKKINHNDFVNYGKNLEDFNFSCFYLYTRAIKIYKSMIIKFRRGHAVVQLVEALSYKLEGRVFDFR